MKGYSFRSLTDLVLKIFKTKITAGTGLSGGGSLEADRTLTVNYGTTAGTAAQGNDSRLSDSREWVGETIIQAEVEAGIATTRRAFTAQRVRQSIIAWWNNTTGAFGRDLITSADSTTARSKLSLFTSATRWPTLAEVTDKPTNYPTNWATVNDKPIVQTVGTSTTDLMSQKAVTDALAEITKRLFPVGTCYTQYHNTPEPSVLFGGVWDLMFADKGVFFRTEGGSAGPFDGAIQQDLFKAHNHTASTNSTGAHAHTATTTSAGAHAHTASTNSTGAHTHSLSGTAASAGAHSHSIPARSNSGGGNGYVEDGDSGGTARTTNTGSAGAHTHSISGTAASAGGHAHTVTVASGGAHTHTVTVASGGAHEHTVSVANTGNVETRPINVTIRVWKRTA